MLKFEGFKEFDIEKINGNSYIAKYFQIVFSDDVLNENDSERVEKKLLNHSFAIKDEKINIKVIYNIDLDFATISMDIYCPLIHESQVQEERLLKFLDNHKINFEEYYNHIKPY